jgi:hypothetical protein
MFDAKTTALLRAVLDDVCGSLSPYETGIRAYVASKILEAAAHGEMSADDLTRIARRAAGHVGYVSVRSGS